MGDISNIYLQYPFNVLFDMKKISKLKVYECRYCQENLTFHDYQQHSYNIYLTENKIRNVGNTFSYTFLCCRKHKNNKLINGLLTDTKTEKHKTFYVNLFFN